MRRAARRRGSGSSAIAGSTPASSTKPGLEARDRRLDLGRERRRARAAAEAGGHLGAPEPALLEPRARSRRDRRRAAARRRCSRDRAPARDPRASAAAARARRAGAGCVMRSASWPSQRAASSSASPARIGCGELGGLGERRRDGARETLGARRQRAAGRDGQHDRDAVARLGVDDRHAAGTRPPRAGGARPRAAPRARARAAARAGAARARRRPPSSSRAPGRSRAASTATRAWRAGLGDVVADGLDDLGPVEQAARVDAARRDW